MAQANANDPAADAAPTHGTNAVERTRKPSAKANTREHGKNAHSLHRIERVKKAAKTTPAETKASIVLKNLQSAKGSTMDALMSATGWQAHSVRSFLSAVVKRKLGLKLVSETGKDGVRRYKIEGEGKAG